MMIGLLVSFALLSIVMVLAMVPLSAELISASDGMPQHRRRLRGLGGVGVLTEWLLPRALDQRSPRAFWAMVYALCWAGLLVLAGMLIATSEPHQRLHNLIVVAAVAGGWWCVQAAIIWLGRALARTNRSAPHRAPAAAGPAEDPEDVAEPEAVDDSEEDDSIAPEPATPHTPARSSVGKMRSTVVSALWLLGALLFIGIGQGLAERSQTLQAADRFLNAHRALLLGITIGLAALGFVAFMGAILDLILTRGRPLSREEIEAMQARALVSRTPVLARASAYRFTGEAAGAGAHDQWTLGQMKQAWRTRAWRGSRLWKRRFIVCLGVLMLMLGLFGLIIVIGSWGVKLLVALVLSYALIRTAWAVYRAD